MIPYGLRPSIGVDIYYNAAVPQSMAGPDNIGFYRKGPARPCLVGEALIRWLE